MSWTSDKVRLWLAVGIWAMGLIIVICLSWWERQTVNQDAENRLISDAGRTASQMAALLSLPGMRLDNASIKAIMTAAMDDERIYAILIQTKRGIREGQRRNFLWEPVPWDDEIAENCVQGISTIRLAGQAVGDVGVWLSSRLNAEEESLSVQREQVRLVAVASLWTISLLLLLWHWGGFHSLRAWGIASHSASQEAESSAEDAPIVLGLAPTEPDNCSTELASESEGQESSEADDAHTEPLISAKLGRDFQRKHPASWLVTAGMFRQTFGRGPALISRLYAEGELAGLCHLGRMLEQAAPCVGAIPLAEAARVMQSSINDPECKTRALSVENCVRVLEQTLVALGGKRPADATESPEAEDAQEASTEANPNHAMNPTND